MWQHFLRLSPTLLASFFASLVECVEALTVVLAVGSTRGWRSALTGAGAGIAVIAVLIVTLGRALSHIPLHTMQWVVGALLLLFGLRWLRKAVLRASGHIPLHDETDAFLKNQALLEGAARRSGLDKVAFATSFQIVLLEGAEVVVIVLAIGAGAPGLLRPASLGALAALLVVLAAGYALQRPLAKVPENGLKFAVGVLLSAFGTFWFGEGIDLRWPGGDWSLLALVAGFFGVAVLARTLCLQIAKNHSTSGLEIS